MLPEDFIPLFPVAASIHSFFLMPDLLRIFFLAHAIYCVSTRRHGRLIPRHNEAKKKRRKNRADE